MTGQPQLIKGGIHNDHRGRIDFINDFQLDEVKRLYIIKPVDTDVVRAWQGHKHEQKWFYVIAGSFKIVLVKVDNWERPSTNELSLHEFDLNVDKPEVLHIPGGYLNGFKALEPNSQIMVFSDFTTEQSIADDYRFDQNRWFDWSKVNRY